MGYYVSMADSNFIIRANRADAALKALTSLNNPKYDKYKVSDGNGSFHFPWLLSDMSEYSSVADILHDLDFEFILHGENDTCLTGFDSMWHPTISLFLSVLATFVDDGSFITFAGEDAGDMWKYVVEDGELVEYTASIVWVKQHTNPYDEAM